MLTGLSGPCALLLHGMTAFAPYLERDACLAAGSDALVRALGSKQRYHLLGEDD